MSISKIYKTIQSMTLPFTISLSVTDKEKGEEIIESLSEQLLAELNRIEREYSPFKKDSLVNQFRQGDFSLLEINKEFQEIYTIVTTAKTATNGAFDPYHHQEYDPTGFVKGWAIERCFNLFLKPLLEADWVDGVALNGGGDMQFASRPFTDHEWNIAIENPKQTKEILQKVSMKNGTIASSGYSKRGHHIIGNDSTLEQVSVFGEKLGFTDLWATALLSSDADNRSYLISHYNLSALLVFSKKIERYVNGEKYYEKAI